LEWLGWLSLGPLPTLMFYSLWLNDLQDHRWCYPQSSPKQMNQVSMSVYSPIVNQCPAEQSCIAFTVYTARKCPLFK
jgi:hypothetical protein